MCFVTGARDTWPVCGQPGAAISVGGRMGLVSGGRHIFHVRGQAGSAGLSVGGMMGFVSGAHHTWPVCGEV